MDEKTIAEQGPIPAPIGDKWYDWDNVGTNYSFSEIVGDENYLYAPQGNRLIRCDLDGANPVTLVQENYIESIDCIDGNIYYTNDTGLYKIKSDGTGKTRLIHKAVAQFLLINNRIYYLTYADEHIHMLDEKSGKTKDLGFRCSYFSCFDNDTIFYTVYYVGDPDTDVF